MAPKAAKVSGPFSYQAAKQACIPEDMARLACCFLSRNEYGVVDFQLAAQQMNANIKVDSFKRSIWVIETKIKKKQDDAGGFEEFVKSLPAPEEARAKVGKVGGGGGSRKRKATAAAVVDDEDGDGEESVLTSPKKKAKTNGTGGKGKVNGARKAKKAKRAIHEDADAEGDDAEETVAVDGTRVKNENWDDGNGSDADADGVSEGGDRANGLFE